MQHLRSSINNAFFAILLFAGLYFLFVERQFGQAVMPNPKTASTPQVSPTPKSTPKPTPTPVDEEGEPIRIETDLVNLYIRVVDRMGRPVTNLRKQDFKVYENGVLQEIEYFSKELVPTNYALVVDNSGSIKRQLDKVIEAGKVVINSNLPDDETCVIRFISSEKIEVLQDFTSDKSLLAEALDKMFIESGQTAVIDAIYLAAQKVGEYERSINADDRKRSALIVVTDGEDRNSYYTEKQLFELLRELDVQIYTIGFTSDLDKEGGLIKKSPKEKAESLLKRLAEETGGKAYFPQSVSELESIAKDIASEMRTQYVIGYYPTNKSATNGFIPINVVVADGPNKEKRIAITRSGRVPTGGLKNTPTLQPKKNN